jgi:hypothetical protein
VTAERPDSPATEAAGTMTSPRHLQPLVVPTRRIIIAGLAAWVVALVVTLVVPALHTGERSWWPWACVAGFALGGIGFLYVSRGRGNASDAE